MNSISWLWRSLACVSFLCWNVGAKGAPLDLGNRLELFVDTYLIDELRGTRQVLHPPVAREQVLMLDRPWEGIYSGYFTVLKDGAKYRMYYRGMPLAKHDLDTEVTCYAESIDGIQWTKPELGLFEVQGTRRNNVVLARHRACHNFAPFLDANPDALAAMRYKALGGTGEPGLIAFHSPDGIHWTEWQPEPVITRGAFDSQNIAFWSDLERRYVCYFRIFKDGVRWISRTTSPDFLHWTDPVEMVAEGSLREHLYTNQTTPYPRAPHLYLGVPTRHFPGRKVLSDEQAARLGTARGFDFRNDSADIVLTSTRGGAVLDRTFLEAFIRPGRDLRNWTSRASYAAHGILQTDDDELSIYVNQNVGYPTSHVRRYTLRVDGFASVQALYGGGSMTTKPFIFSGRRLVINYATSAGGGIRVGMLDANGGEVEGFRPGDCPEIIGDEIERVVRWNGGSDAGRLSGKAIRLRFEMRDADLFSIRFSE